MLNDILHTVFFLIRVVIWAVVYRIFKSHVEDCGTLLNSRMWFIVDIICLAPLIAVISFIILTPDQTLFIYPACFACIITSLGSIYLTGYISKTVKTSLENQNLRLQESYYKELETNQQEMRKFRHDMNNHLAVLGTLIHEDNKEKTNQYFEDLSLYFSAKGRVFCKNSIVNAVLNAKYNLIQENEIDVFFNIDIDDMIAIDDISLCSIFANTLDNAIEASLQVEDTAKRKITLKARYLNGYFSYEISNVKARPIISKNRKILSTKTHNHLHGIGLNNVTEIVHKYGGPIEVSFDEYYFMVTLLIGAV